MAAGSFDTLKKKVPREGATSLGVLIKTYHHFKEQQNRMGKDGEPQRSNDGIDLARTYDAKAFCRQLSIGRDRERELIARARKHPDIIANGHSVIASGQLLLALLRSLPTQKQKKQKCL